MSIYKFLTGGRAAIYTDVGKALARVSEITRVEYLLGYYPQDGSFDGKYRRINVKVNRPGVRVSFRHGYYARETLQPYDRAEFMAYSRITAAASHPSELKDIPFTLETTPSTDPLGPPQISVQLNINAGALGLSDAGGGFHTGKVYTTVFYADSKGKLLDYVWGAAELKLSEDSYQQVMKSGLPVRVLVPYVAPRQILKIVIYDSGTGRVGSRLVKMR